MSDEPCPATSPVTHTPCSLPAHPPQMAHSASGRIDGVQFVVTWWRPGERDDSWPAQPRTGEMPAVRPLPRSVGRRETVVPPLPS